MSLYISRNLTFNSLFFSLQDSARTSRERKDRRTQELKKERDIMKAKLAQIIKDGKIFQEYNQNLERVKKIGKFLIYSDRVS